MKTIQSAQRLGGAILALLLAATCVPPSWGQTGKRLEPGLSPIMKLQPKGPQSGQSYLWSRINDVVFGPADPAPYSKQVLLPAGTWQIAVQFHATLSDGVDTANKITYASLSCLFVDAAGGRSTTVVATPAMFHHNPSMQDFFYDMTTLQTLNLSYIFTSDGQAIGSVALLCTPSVRNNSISMQNLTISAIPIASVIREQE